MLMVLGSVSADDGIVSELAVRDAVGLATPDGFGVPGALGRSVALLLMAVLHDIIFTPSCFS